MAAVELATAYLSLVPTLEGASGAIGKELGGSEVQGAVGKAGDKAGKTFAGKFSSAGKFAAKAVGVGLLGAAAAGGAWAAQTVRDLANVQRIGALTASTIKATGGAAQRSKADIDAHAGAIEKMSGVEAESVTEGQNMLLTFKNIKGQRFDQATSAMTDMAVAMNKGSLEGLDMKASSIQLGKALNDPVKGVSALSKVGVSFTEQQKEQIKTMVEAGDVAGAQGVILDEMKAQFGGAAKAAGSTFQGNVAKLKNSFGNLSEGLLAGLLPALTTFVGFLTTQGVPALERMGTWIKTVVVPAVKELASGFSTNVLPVLQRFGGYIVATVVPVVRTLATGLGNVIGFVIRNKDAFIALAIAAGSFVAIMRTAAIIKSVAGFLQLLTVANIKATVAQWAQNAAVLANPYVAIIAGIIALVGALVWFFTKTKTGQRIVSAAWGGIKSAMSAVTDWWTKTAWPAIRTAISSMGAWFVSVKNKVVSAWNSIKAGAVNAWNWVRDKVILAHKVHTAIMAAVFTAVKNKVVGAWNAIKDGAGAVWRWIRTWVIDPFKLGIQIMANVIGAQKDRIVNAWRAMRDGLNTIGAWIRSNIFDPIKRAVRLVGEAFKATPGVVKTAWAKIKGYAAKPINFIINTVYTDGIKRLWDSVAKKFGLDLKLPTIKPIKGFDRGGWTGPGSRLQPAGVVHADEFVVKKSSRGRIERQAPGFLDYLNRHGTIPGFAGGGLVNAARWWMERGARATEHPLFGGVHPGHMAGSLHYSGNAVDLNYGPGGENATEKSFFDRLMPAFRAAFPGLGVLWRAPGHFNHAHIDTGGISSIGGGGGGGGGLDFLGLAGRFSALKDKLAGLGKSPWGQIAVGMGKKLIGGPVEYIKNKLGSFAEGAGDVFQNVKTAGVKAQVRALAMTRGWGFGSQWNALDWIVNKESGWNPNAANPSSSARGLFQKMTSIHGALESTAAGQAGWGLKYIKDRYGDPVNAKAFHQSHGYYADGGRVFSGLYDQGGWLPDGGIGVNRSGRPEAVLDPEESRALKAGLNNGPLIGTLVAADMDEAVYKMQRFQRRAAVRSGLAGMR